MDGLAHFKAIGGIESDVVPLIAQTERKACHTKVSRQSFYAMEIGF